MTDAASMNNKRARTQQSDIPEQGGAGLIPDSTLNTDEIGQWISSKPIQKHMVTTINSFKALSKSVQTASAAVQKLREHEAKGTIPAMLKGKEISLPDSDDKDSECKATELRINYEKQLLSLTLNSRIKEESTLKSKLKEFFKDQTNEATAFIEREHSALELAGLTPLHNVQTYVNALIKQLEAKARSWIAEDSMAEHYRLKKAEKADKSMEIEERMLNNPEQTIKETMDKKIQPLLKIVKELDKKVTQMQKAPEKFSEKKNNNSDKKKNIPEHKATRKLSYAEVASRGNSRSNSPAPKEKKDNKPKNGQGKKKDTGGGSEKKKSGSQTMRKHSGASAPRPQRK